MTPWMRLGMAWLSKDIESKKEVRISIVHWSSLREQARP